ncbi:MAG: hemolysin III family protein [Burkholderiales bacterium]|nr:hemolysin III family protein [Burkholderiales bacterium]
MGSRLRFPWQAGQGGGAGRIAPGGDASGFAASAAAPLAPLTQLAPLTPLAPPAPRTARSPRAAQPVPAGADRHDGRRSRAVALARRARALAGGIPPAERRPQSAAEERLNTLSHGIGFVAAAAAWPLLSDHAAQRGGALAAFGIAVFCLAAILVYAASMVYHALPEGRAKDWARRLDHASIFVFIAGSYTPFALGPLHGGIGEPLLAGVWGVALIGAGCKFRGRLQHRLVSTLLYCALGWMALALLGPLAARSGAAVPWLLAGGAAYTLGAAFYLADDRLRFAHFVWHLAVLAGSGCHVLAALATMG